MTRVESPTLIKEICSLTTEHNKELLNLNFTREKIKFNPVALAKRLSQILPMNEQLYKKWSSLLEKIEKTVKEIDQMKEANLIKEDRDLKKF